MAKVYSRIEGFRECPQYDHKTYKSFDEYEKACDEWEAELKTLIKKANACPEAGEIIQFPVADGYARYAVFSLKPVALIHIPTGDAWHFEYAERLLAMDIREKIRQARTLKKLFKQKG